MTKRLVGLVLMLAWAACLAAAPLSVAEIDRLYKVDQVVKANIAQMEKAAEMGSSFYAYQKEYEAAVPGRPVLPAARR